MINDLKLVVMGLGFATGATAIAVGVASIGLLAIGWATGSGDPMQSAELF